MKNVIFLITIMIGTFAFYKLAEPDLKAYDKYMCAVYGYYEDCKTPLPEHLKLK